MSTDTLSVLPKQLSLELGDARSVGEWLNSIREVSRSESEKGQWFENLFARVARNDPEFEIDGIWRWADWPERESLTGLTGQDIGIDLVAKHMDGTWIAVQCKCYEPTRRIGKGEIQKFIAGSQHQIFGLRWIVTTCRWGPVAEAALKGSNIRRIDFLEYQDSLVQEKVERPERMPFVLQQEAIDNVLEGLANHDRGRLIMACGTGKTFTALRIAEKHVPDGKSILFLAPSIALVSQARREWLTHTTRPLSCVVVCSDSSAGGRNEREDIGLSEISCPVTSDAREIAHKLTQGKATKVVFCTYQSLMRISEAQRDFAAPDFTLTIADEAHRTTGVLSDKRERVNFQLVHDETSLKTAKRLYMTATPRIYSERSKGALAKKDIKVVDMSDQEIYGPQFHRLRFKTAVEAGILSDYRVIVLGVDRSQVKPGLQKSLEELAHDNRKMPTLDDMTRVLGVSLAINGLAEGQPIERPGPLARTMAYANSIERSKWFARALEAAQVKAATTRKLSKGERARQITTNHLDASSSALERHRKLRELASAEEDNKLRVICNVKLFTEGVDVPSLNAVAFLDPRDSQVDVVQAVGRVMRRTPQKTLGYIVVPVVVEPGRDVADALARSSEGFQTVGKVLRALQAHDERLHQNIAHFVSVLEARDTDGERKAPGEAELRDEPDLFDALRDRNEEGIFAHVAAASGLGKPGLLVADQIEWEVKRAAVVFQSEEVEDSLAEVLGLSTEGEGASKSICTIAALLLCNACLMHRRLKELPQNSIVTGLGAVGASDNPLGTLKAAWETILSQDYAPVFEPALGVLTALPDNSAIRKAVCGLAERADTVADSLSELGYDHAGPLYHRILGSASSDGAYYTNNISALMLARLALDESFVDWSDHNRIAKLRIIDPACGTGTLLMAVLRTVKDRVRQKRRLDGEDADILHSCLVEDVLCGLDINRHGVQLAACNLTLGAPTVDYSRMNLHTMKHGPQEDGSVRAGSLEILGTNRIEVDLFKMVSHLSRLEAAGGEQVAGGSGKGFPFENLDLVIMNPPFTANDKRGRKFSKEVTRKMQEREINIRNGVVRRDPSAAALITTNSVRTFFTSIADAILRRERATLAEVLPATACVGSGGLKERKFLSDRFHIERVITTHDPKHINFSENTTIHECLLICRRRSASKRNPTEFFSLNEMPNDASGAIACADAIAAGEEGWGSRLLWPEDRVSEGDWSPVQWYDGSLAGAAWEIEGLNSLEPLGVRHAIGPTGRAAQDSWRKRDEASARDHSEAVLIFDSTSSELRRCMAGEPEQWVVPGGRREHLWQSVKVQGSTLLVTIRLNTVSGRLTALHSNQSTFGFGWIPVTTTDSEESKALSLWLNSTFARLMLLNRRAKTLTYPKWSIDHWKQIRIPKYDDVVIQKLASVWEDLKNKELLEMRHGESDPARVRIDAAASEACGVDESVVAGWRRKLSHEPTITNQRAA